MQQAWYEHTNAKPDLRYEGMPSLGDEEQVK